MALIHKDPVQGRTLRLEHRRITIELRRGGRHHEALAWAAEHLAQYAPQTIGQLLVGHGSEHVAPRPARPTQERRPQTRPSARSNSRTSDPDKLPFIEDTELWRACKDAQRAIRGGAKVSAAINAAAQRHSREAAEVERQLEGWLQVRDVV
jgi:hypothetical protein